MPRPWSDRRPPPGASALTALCLLLVFSAETAARPARPGRVWLRVFSSSRHQEAQQVRALLAPEGLDGGRLRQVFLRRSLGGQGTTVYEVLTGPFWGAPSALLYGLALRRDPRFARAGRRLRSMAVLLPTSFLPLPIQIDSKSLAGLNPGGRKPYPRQATLLTARAYGFSLPAPALPPIERATAEFRPWRPLLVLGEQTACDKTKRNCLRWFEVLHPVLIRTAFVPAHCLTLRQRIKRYTVPAGKTTEDVNGALWPIGRSPRGRLYRVMFRRGTLPPQLHTMALPDHQKPPFRLVVDRHGPGIYNAEGKVVRRIKLRSWIYVRPPLWRSPDKLGPAGRPPPRRPAMTGGPPRRPPVRRPAAGRRNSPSRRRQ